MAVMYPTEIPISVVNDPLRSGERKVYNALRSQLDDQFDVFYSIPYLDIDESGNGSDGECDFIIAHRSGGLLFLEVKGGRIRIDENNQWYSKSGAGVEYRIKHPIDQAKRNKYYILDKLKKERDWGKRHIHIGHCAVLPDVRQVQRNLRFDVPVEILAFAENMDDLKSFVCRLMGLASPEIGVTNNPLGEDGLRVFKDMINRRIHFRFSLSSRLEDDQQTIIQKTKEQILLLDESNENPRMSIYGAAGTGKTELAIEKVISLAEEGFNTLFLCFNHPLGVDLQNRLGDINNLTVNNFHGFCRVVDRLVNNDGEDNDRIVSMLFDNFEQAKCNKFDAIVIDEGQDFRDDWLAMLQMLLNDYDLGRYYIFYDDNQNVRHSSKEFIRSLPFAVWRLSKNFRNTKAIFNMTEPFYIGSAVRPTGPDGLDVEFNEYHPSVSPWVRTNSIVRHMIDIDGISPEDITVLSNTRSEIDDYINSLKGQPRIGGTVITNAAKRVKGAVVLDSVRRFKGLENKIIVLMCTGGMERDHELLYTAMTRARTLLHIIVPEGKKKFISNPV